MSVTMADQTQASSWRTARSTPQLGIGPQRARLDLVEILDRV
jgi:hypothetical protein